MRRALRKRRVFDFVPSYLKELRRASDLSPSMLLCGRNLCLEPIFPRCHAWLGFDVITRKLYSAVWDVFCGIFDSPR